MTQERLSALASVSIEKGIIKKLQSHFTWHDVLIDKFAKKKDRRVIFRTNINLSIYILYIHVIQPLITSWPPQISNPPSATAWHTSSQ